MPLDTWVGRFVRITTPRHNGTTGLVHRTGNGWVNLQTALGDVAKRAYDLVVIPEERANIGSIGGMLKGDAARGKRYRGGPKGECTLLVAAFDNRPSYWSRKESWVGCSILICRRLMRRWGGRRQQLWIWRRKEGWWSVA